MATPAVQFFLREAGRVREIVRREPSGYICYRVPEEGAFSGRPIQACVTRGVMLARSTAVATDAGSSQWGCFNSIKVSVAPGPLHRASYARGEELDCL